MMRNMKADVMRNATKQTKKNYFIVFDWGGGGSNSIFVCRFCEHFAKKRRWTEINVHKIKIVCKSGKQQEPI